MSTALREAICRRWNDVGLSASVAPLAFGERGPAADPLPRASYALGNEFERSRSRGIREVVQPVLFQVCAKTDAAITAALDAIDEAFVNAEAALLHPLQLSEEDGRVLAVDHAGRRIEREGTAWRGELAITIQWCRSNNTPV